jgi:predicted DNA-binding transcriptional regulator AlpA
VDNAESTRPWDGIPASGPLFGPKEAAEYISYSKKQYYALAAKGDLPRPIKIGRGYNGASGVPQKWLDAVIASRAAAQGERS